MSTKGVINPRPHEQGVTIVLELESPSARTSHGLVKVSMQQQEQTGSFVCWNTTRRELRKALSSKHIWCLFTPILNIASKLGLPITQKGQRNFGKSAASCCLLDSWMYLKQSYTPMVQDLRSMSIWTGPTNPYAPLPFPFEFTKFYCLDCIKFQNYFKSSTLVLDLTTHCIFLLVHPE